MQKYRDSSETLSEQPVGGDMDASLASPGTPLSVEGLILDAVTRESQRLEVLDKIEVIRSRRMHKRRVPYILRLPLG